MPLVSIVIPTFNGASTIRATLESVLGQDEIDFEVIISDQNSSDSTLEIVNEFRNDPRTVILNGPKRLGAAANWNHVSESASGEFIKLVCQDDTLLPGMLARQVEILQDAPQVVLTACRRDVVSHRGVSLFKARGLKGLSEPSAGREAVRVSLRSGTNLFGEPACVLMRTEAFRRAGGWDDRWSFLIDLATYARVLELGEFVPDLAVGAQFRVLRTQWSLRLRKRQANEFSEFVEIEFAREKLGLSRFDVVLGKFHAYRTAVLRRLVYLALPALEHLGRRHE